MITLDEWQKNFIEYEGHKVLVAGRQTGKSEAQAWDNAEFALKNAGTTSLIISKTERQAQELLIKVLNYLMDKAPQRIGKGKYKPLKSVIWVTHNKQAPSRIMCIPVGVAGEGARGLTIHKLSVDEAQLPADEVFFSLLPMLLTTGGKISLTGTPQGKRGFFWKAFENKDNQFKVFCVSSVDVINKRPISDGWSEYKRRAALDFIEQQRSMMSNKFFRQEFLAEFLEDLQQAFSDESIKACCVLERRPYKRDNRRYTLGVDVGRIIDPSTFEVLDGTIPDSVEQVENIVRFEYPITATAEEVIKLENSYRFEKIGIDGGGMGAGVIDILIKEQTTRRKVVDLNNAKRPVEYSWDKKGRTRSLLKEDMYRNLMAFMERRKIKLLNDESVINSLRSCQLEYVEGSKDVLIHGHDTHIVEGIIRALWLLREQNNGLWVR